jgi:hypothetical protein
MIGFRDLSDAALWSVIEIYRQALEGDDNYPCGASRKRVKQWLQAALAEREARHAVAPLKVVR